MIIKKANNMKKLHLLALCTLLFALAACNNNPEPPTPTPIDSDPVGTTYPRMQLIEHFTGQGCGYCPYGMDLIYNEYSKNPDNYVWISNHTYGKDNFTISGSNTIAKKLKSGGAPEISLNRSKNSGERTYHPGYMAQYIVKEATTATSVISLSRQYDATTRELVIDVTGKTSESDLDSVLLTVAVTESGMIAQQSDYFDTWEGWSKFRHTHAVRVFATEALGDLVKMNKRTFSAKYTLTLSDKWEADNCEIVAWITPCNDNWPVINAAKVAVVEGTQGGEDIRHGGVEEVAVSENYPEIGTPNAESVMTTCNAYYTPTTDVTVMVLELVNTDQSVAKLSNTAMYAYARLYLAVAAGATTIPAGTYTFKSDEEAQIGDAWAGFRNDQEHVVEGSQFLWVYKSGSSLYIARQWMLVSGSVVVTESGLELTGTTKNGSSVHATYTGEITPKKQSSAPARISPLFLPEE